MKPRSYPAFRRAHRAEDSLGCAVPVDLYCERIDASFWSEPLNATSNASFIIAAFLVWREVRKTFLRGDRDLLVLTRLLAAVGVGSSLFHTVATEWSRWADVVPIAATLLWFLWVFLRRAARFSLSGVAAGLGGFLLLSIAFGVLIPRETVNGSNAYFSCVVTLLAMGSFLRHKHIDGAADLHLAAAVFVVSLIFRSIDLAVCHAIPVGTHFAWHILNGAAFYLASRGLVRSLASAAVGDRAPTAPTHPT